VIFFYLFSCLDTTIVCLNFGGGLNLGSFLDLDGTFGSVAGHSLRLFDVVEFILVAWICCAALSHLSL
jgi:hypothetical protein